jgi:hypothetical protein
MLKVPAGSSRRTLRLYASDFTLATFFYLPPSKVFFCPLWYIRVLSHQASGRRSHRRSRSAELGKTARHGPQWRSIAYWSEVPRRETPSNCRHPGKSRPLSLARIMHHLPRFCMPGPHADCTRTPSIRPVWIGVRQLAVQRIGD